jgi:hypothetical protein
MLLQRHTRDDIVPGPGVDDVCELSGVVFVESDRMAAAVELVEGLGCVVLTARPMKPGRFAMDVRMSLCAANAVAWAALRGDIGFARLDQYAAVAS